eukprot:CAMPEP_0168562440 /NCGR_PEP_ID=MMETSP0413-20121227/12124_1 /TAXON_ID=136452 /ORGANISM="Filamoeba nolandi, Strain NC-AS-23-1" /LENGTH=95 /DNA_ID=CAMNT_0008593867 /DNA_START=61 /DNA_END=344 /DNA_ORIENTATION=-
MAINVKVGLPTLLLGGALFSAYHYKPSKEHFQTFFKQWASEQVKKDLGSSSNSVMKFFKGATANAVGELLSRASDPQYQDFIFCAKVTVRLDDTV